MADGWVLHRGRPVAGCRVVADDEASGTVIAHGETGGDGAFHLDADDGLVVAICATDVLGVAAAPAAGAPLELELTDVAPTHALTVSVTGGDLPDWVQPQVRLMPLGVGDLDGRVLRWITAPVDGLSHRALARIEGRTFTRDAQAGRWWIAATAFEERAVRAADQPDPRSWTATQAHTADGTALTPARDGFVLQLDGPLAVTLELAG
jgi:hypothetical protein